MVMKMMMIAVILFSFCVDCFSLTEGFPASSAEVGHSWRPSSLLGIFDELNTSQTLLSTRRGCTYSSKVNYPFSFPEFGFGFISVVDNHDAVTLGIFVSADSFEDFLDMDDKHEVVWSANGDHPIFDKNFSLEFTAKGNLVLKDGNGPQVWSTNTSGRSVRSMNLTCEGNLILVDDKNAIVWQSFDHPTDTWLLGQALLYDSPRLTSREELFSIKVAKDHLAACANTDRPVTYSYAYISPKKIRNILGGITFVRSRHGVFINATSFTYIRLQPDGSLQVLTYNGSEVLLDDLLHLSFCEYPSVCGNYGICYGDGRCNCPQEGYGTLDYFKPVDVSRLDKGCARVDQLSCSHETNSQTFLRIDNVTYFGFDTYLNLTGVDAETCKRACLDTCSCVAAIFHYEENLLSGNCSLPSKLLTLEHIVPGLYPHLYKSTTFFKVETRYTTTNSSLLPKVVPNVSTKVSSSLLKVVASVSASLLLLIILSAGACYYAAMIRRKTDKYPYDLVIDTVTRFSFETLRVATKDFENRLGRGGFGSVFEGTLTDGKKVAVKRLESVGQGRKEFLAEVHTIGTIHHFNLVKLVGFCDEGLHRLLVYEFMVNGSLDKWIFNCDLAHTLSWSLRLKIISGIAKGLEYLHENCNPNVIHFDIKPQNILLDADFNVRISDFGLARLVEHDQAEVMTLIKGTPGYIAPELIAGRAISVKVDVYSFGVLALEIVCGRKNVGPPGEELLTNLVKVKADEDRLSDMVDERTEDMQLQKEEAVKMMKIGIWCLQPHFIRPTMSTVVKVLQDHPNMETLGDLSYLTIAHEAIPGDVNPTYSTRPTESLLSGPR